jgi:CRISPR system Cascade subunit CasB
MGTIQEKNAYDQKLLEWWKELEENKGDRANLRRCATPLETTFLPASYKLLSKLQTCSSNWNRDKICAIAGILSHVREDTSEDFAKKLSQKKPGSDQALFSDLRFRKLLQYSNIAEDELFYQNMIRALHILEFKVNICELFNSLYFWGDRVKKDWAHKYYA